jgi:hypothetical protein
MSWGTIRKGTREQVTAEISADFENFTKNYPRGTNEGEDVEVARMRCLALLATIDMSVDAYFEDDVVQASANGSHSWSGDKEKPRTANFTVKVERVPRVLEFSALNKLRVACGLEPRPMGPSMARTAGAHVAIGERTPYHCRRCGELGHNARRCGA